MVGYTLMLLGVVFLPTSLTGCDSKSATSPTGKDSSTQLGKDNTAGKPKPPDRDPG
jgi:hypothetical protein